MGSNAPVTDEMLQRAVDAVGEHGGVSAAANALGIPFRTFSRHYNTGLRKFNHRARRGHAPGHFNSGVAPGFMMNKVTIQRDAGGNVERTWERQSPEDEQWQAAMRLSLSDLAEEVKGLAPVIAEPSHYDHDLMTVIPMGDPHFGLLSWAKETGDDFNLDIAERLTFGAVDRLVSLSPSSETAMLLNLGDYWHADNSSNRTPKSGAALDVDGRFPKIASVGFRAMVRCINRMRERHKKVIVRCNRGNHDPHQSFMLAMALDAYFHDVPAVQVDLSPASFYYHRFGKVLIGSTHGDGAKLGDLPLIMATDVPEDWAHAAFRHWHCGHFHHDQMKEHPGCSVETHRTLAAGDSWHRHEGYRSGRDMKAIVYHRDYGEVTRVRCGIARITASRSS